jgi:hypothetical protein
VSEKKRDNFSSIVQVIIDEDVEKAGYPTIWERDKK